MASIRRAVSLAPLAVQAARHAIGSRSARKYSRVYYVTEGSDWSIKWDGHYITQSARKLAGIDCVTTEVQRGIANQVVHFGSRNLFLTSGDPPRIVPTHKSNRVAFTWFHGDPDSDDAEERRFAQLLPEAVDRASVIVTSATATASRLANAGVPLEKTRTIPLGVDLQAFRPPTPAERSNVRKELGLSEDTICIGSFQKDGVGWGYGSTPKLVKGPDVLLDTVEALAKNHRIHVLLTGPARGYVIDGLNTLGVPFTHRYLKNYLEIPRYYHGLDLYIVSSRDEGGPKMILESMASGVPVVSTTVGMAPDVITDGKDGFLVSIEDSDALAEAANKLIENDHLRSEFAAAGLATSQRYDWETIGKQYAEEVYIPLLSR